jgi:hypothetical protein
MYFFSPFTSRLNPNLSTEIFCMLLFKKWKIHLFLFPAAILPQIISPPPPSNLSGYPSRMPSLHAYARFFALHQWARQAPPLPISQRTPAARSPPYPGSAQRLDHTVICCLHAPALGCAVVRPVPADLAAAWPNRRPCFTSPSCSSMGAVSTYAVVAMPWVPHRLSASSLCSPVSFLPVLTTPDATPNPSTLPSPRRGGLHSTLPRHRLSPHVPARRRARLGPAKDPCELQPHRLALPPFLQWWSPTPLCCLASSQCIQFFLVPCWCMCVPCMCVRLEHRNPMSVWRSKPQRDAHQIFGKMGELGFRRRSCKYRI